MSHGRFKYKHLSKYPHMKPVDVRIWERFITKYRDFFESVDYDYHVGDGADFLPSDEGTPDGRENRLYRKKIDVVGYVGTDVYIIEVKDAATPSALGQIIMYGDLYAKEKDAHPNPRKMLVCGHATDEMQSVFKAHKIVVWVV